MKRVLVATDGSEAAGRAAQVAKRDDAQLLIVNIVGGYGLPDGVFSHIIRTEQASVKEMLESLSAETLKKAHDRARASGAPSIQLESRAGDVAETLIEIAKEKAVEAVVVGKRGAGRLERLLLGSVSRKLVNLAPLPVIVVP